LPIAGDIALESAADGTTQQPAPTEIAAPADA